MNGTGRLGEERSEQTSDEAIATSSGDSGYKDELNLAEFPIAALTDRVPDGQLSLVFEDRLDQRDPSLPQIVRRLTILGAHKHGLPTALDDEVMVGLIQLTKRRNGFTDPKVAFSRYELIDLLGWPQTGPSYRRIEEALHRWVGVVLMYENAWWDNRAKSWVDENFHVLDNVTIYDRERRRPSAKGPKRPRADGRTEALPLSSFRWNEVIFRSFQSGNLKQLDLEFYLSLRLPTTKRMFRFLDKRFYKRDRLDFDLRTLACEHIGMSRSYKPTELKRRLRPALEELEQAGFLEPLPDKDRYVPTGRGQWRIILPRGPRGRAPSAIAGGESAVLIDTLKSRGVTRKAAAELVASQSPARIREKLEVFDWMIKNGDKRIGKNPAGYLVASIRSDYQAPGDFKPRVVAARSNGGRREVRRLNAPDPKPDEAGRLEGLRAQWEALPELEREAILSQIKAENPGLRRWKAMLEPLCLAEMERRLGAKVSAPADGQGRLFADQVSTD